MSSGSDQSASGGGLFDRWTRSDDDVNPVNNVLWVKMLTESTGAILATIGGIWIALVQSPFGAAVSLLEAAAAFAVEFVQTLVTSPAESIEMAWGGAQSFVSSAGPLGYIIAILVAGAAVYAGSAIFWAVVR